jgi:hypothetical protein
MNEKSLLDVQEPKTLDFGRTLIFKIHDTDRFPGLSKKKVPGIGKKLFRWMGGKEKKNERKGENSSRK